MMKQIKNLFKSTTSGHETLNSTCHIASKRSTNPPILVTEGDFHEVRKRKTSVKTIGTEFKSDIKTNIPTYPELNRYKLMEKLGDGAFSDVYKAYDLTSQKSVAIKIVRKFQLNTAQRGNILKEVTIMRNLNHPNVAKLLDFKEAKDFYYLILELLEGGELFHRIVKLTHFSEHLSCHVIRQVALGIRYLHEEKGVIHRDIKPENLLFQGIPYKYGDMITDEPVELDEEKLDEGDYLEGIGGGGIGVVKIADFGLSKVVWNSDTMTPCGTVGYTAPEVVRDERYSKSVDMWALGCVLYTLLCGFPPFYDEDIQVLTEKVAIGYYSFPSPWWDDISDTAKDLISHLLTVDPSARYTIDEFFSHPWVQTKMTKCNPLESEVNSIQTAASSPTGSDDEFYLKKDGTSVVRRSRHLMPLPVTPNISIKEAIDVSYAIHRMEDEEAAKHHFRSTIHAQNGHTNHQGFLEMMNNHSDEADVNLLNVAFQNAGMSGGYKPRRRGNLTPEYRANFTAETLATKLIKATTTTAATTTTTTATTTTIGSSNQGFQLSLDQATLLSRRKVKMDELSSD